MPSALSDHERQRIIDLLPNGWSCRRIAREVQHSTSTVSLIAKSVGHEFGRANLARAREVRSAYNAEWRADFGRRLAAECDVMLDDMHAACLVYNFGGKDNEYNDHELDKPTPSDRLKFMQSIRLASQTILDIDRHDSAVGGLTDVQEYLATQKGERPT